MSVHDEITELRTQVDELTKLLEERTVPIDRPSTTEPAANVPANVPARASSRRAVFKTAGVAAAGALAGSIMTGQPAAAADPNDIVKGVVNTATARTDLRYSSATPLTHNVFTAQNSSFGLSAFPAAIGGYGGTEASVGVYGFTSTGGTSASTGHAMVASASGAARSHLFMVPLLSPPKTATDTHRAGELRMDNTASLWQCTDSAPAPNGTWKKICGPTTSGAFHLLPAAVRAYDSRVSEGGTGPLPANGTQTVDMKVAGTPATFNGVLANLTIVSPSGSSFAVLWSNGVTKPLASSVNFAAGAAVGNNVTTAVDGAGLAQIFSPVSTEYVVDVMGYFE